MADPLSSLWLLTGDAQLEVTPNSPNEFCLFFRDETFVRLRAESNLVRDIIVLTLRAFCKVAVESEETNDAVARGLSPMLTLRTLAEKEATEKHQQLHPGEQPVGVSTSFGGLFGLRCMLSLYTPSLAFHQAQEAASPVPSYDLPWNRGGALGLSASTSPGDKFPGALQEVEDDDTDEFLDEDRPHRKLSIASNLSAARSSFFGDEWDESLLLDAEALIGNAMKMGLQNQILPREPKRISIMDIPDLQIIEAMEGSRSKQQKRGHRDEAQDTRRRRRRLSAIGSDGSTPRGSFDGSNSDDDNDNDNDSGLDESSGAFFESKPELDAKVPLVLDPSCIDDAIQDFMAADDSDEAVKKGVDVDALRSQYVSIFVALQRELHQYKQRVSRLTQQLDEKRDENTGFRTDIDTLQDALRSLQVSNKMYELVADDLRHKKRTALSSSSSGGDDGADVGVTLAAASKFFMDLSSVSESSEPSPAT